MGSLRRFWPGVLGLVLLILLFWQGFRFAGRVAYPVAVLPVQKFADNMDAFFIRAGFPFQGPFFLAPHGVRYLLGQSVVILDSQKNRKGQEETLKVILKKVRMEKRRAKLIDLTPEKPHVVFENY